MKRGLLILSLALLPLAAVAEVAAFAEVDAPGTDLVGRWTLDPDRSDSIVPMMELMGAPWAVRKMVGSLRPTLTLSLTPGGLRVLNQTPIRDTDREIITDGEKRESKDALDRIVTEWAQWQSDGSLKVWRQVLLEGGPEIAIEATWRRNGEAIELESLANAPGEDPIRTLRVFAPDRD